MTSSTSIDSPDRDDLLEGLDLKFHHLGLAVRRPKMAVRFLTQLGYQVGKPILDPEQNANLIMCSSDTKPAIEIIYPAAPAGPLEDFLKDRSEMIYHICYQTRSLAAVLVQLRDRGIRWSTVVPPRPAVLFSGQRVSFYLVAGFGLIEIRIRPFWVDLN